MLNRFNSAAAALVLAASLAACGTTIRETVINHPPRPMAARPPESVEMFTSGAPTRPHVDVAFLEAEESTSFSTDGTADMLAKLRKRGAERGCDGIVIGGLSSRDPGLNDGESWWNHDAKARKGVYATCIMYTEPAAAPIVASPTPTAVGG